MSVFYKEMEKDWEGKEWNLSDILFLIVILPFIPFMLIIYLIKNRK